MIANHQCDSFFLNNSANTEQSPSCVAERVRPLTAARGGAVVGRHFYICQSKWRQSAGLDARWQCNREREQQCLNARKHPSVHYCVHLSRLGCRGMRHIPASTWQERNTTWSLLRMGRRLNRFDRKSTHLQCVPMFVVPSMDNLSWDILYLCLWFIESFYKYVQCCVWLLKLVEKAGLEQLVCSPTK